MKILILFFSMNLYSGPQQEVIKNFQDYQIALRKMKNSVEDMEKTTISAKDKNGALIFEKNDVYRTSEMLGEGSFKKVFLGILEKNGDFRYVAVADIEKNSNGFKIFNGYKDLLQKIKVFPKGVEPILKIEKGLLSFSIIHPLYDGDLSSLPGFLRKNPDYLIGECFDDLRSGLDFIHSKKLFHLDLKPANFLFSIDQSSKKLDCVVADLDNLMTDLVMTTPYYFPYFMIKDPQFDLIDRYSMAFSIMEIMSKVSGDKKFIDEINNFGMLNGGLNRKIISKQSLKKASRLKTIRIKEQVINKLKISAEVLLSYLLEACKNSYFNCYIKKGRESLFEYLNSNFFNHLNPSRTLKPIPVIKPRPLPPLPKR